MTKTCCKGLTRTAEVERCECGVFYADGVEYAPKANENAEYRKWRNEGIDALEKAICEKAKWHELTFSELLDTSKRLREEEPECTT